MGDKKQQKRDPRDIKNTPFKAALKDFKVKMPGPECVRCGEPIDTRPGWSLGFQRGSRKHQRHGWYHEQCETEAALDLAKAQGKVVAKKVGKDTVLVPGHDVSIEVPVFSEDDLDLMLEEK